MLPTRRRTGGRSEGELPDILDANSSFAMPGRAVELRSKGKTKEGADVATNPSTTKAHGETLRGPCSWFTLRVEQEDVVRTTGPAAILVTNVDIATPS